MKKGLILSIAIFLTGFCFGQSLPPAILYRGQTPPGNTPEIFPLSVKEGSFAAERIAISGDGREIYYSEIEGYYPVRGESIKRYSFSDGKWVGPEILFEGFIAPALSISGDTMYVQKNSETYLSVKSNTGWTEPLRILTELNAAHYYQITGKGNRYVSSIPEKGEGGFDWCRVTHNSVPEAMSLWKPLNSGADNLDFFVARDESFIITTSPGGLCISFPQKDGSWSDPMNLGPTINFGLGMWGPCVSEDGRYLFYSTGTKPDYSDVYVYRVRIDEMIDQFRHMPVK